MSMSRFGQHPLYPGEAVPLFISAGILKEPQQIEAFLEIPDPNVVPALTLGSFTLGEWAGNARPGQTDFVYYPDRQLAGNARGLPNPGVAGMINLDKTVAELNKRGIKSIISVTNLPHETPLDVIPMLCEIAATLNPTAIEVNLSCPNGLDADGNLHPPLCTDAEASQIVMQRARRLVGDEVVLGIKDSPHAQTLKGPVDAGEIANLALGVADSIDFVTGINTIGGQPFPEIECAGGRGGASGPAVADVANQHLRVWQTNASDIAYLSTGGIDSDNAVNEIPQRLNNGAIRVGGAQEFYRAAKPHLLVERWVQVL